MTECDWRSILKDCRDYSRIRCLLAVYLLTPNEKTGHGICSYELEVASKDIAEIMSVSRPSVHVLLDALQKEGLVFKEHYGRIVITPPGRKRALYLKKHIQTMAAAFEESLGTSLLESAALALHTMIPQMAKDAGVSEQMKMTNQLRWVGMMNAIKNQVEEIIWNEVVYK